jgi:hypothetical protein
MTHVKNALFYLAIGFFATMLSVWLQSDFLQLFLSSGLITLLVALLAINTTSIGLIASKARELADKHGHDFGLSIRSMQHSIVEQIILIVIAIIVSVIQNSVVVRGLLPYHDIIWTTVLAAVFIWAIQVLRDTASGIFDVLGQNK